MFFGEKVKPALVAMSTFIRTDSLGNLWGHYFMRYLPRTPTRPPKKGQQRTFGRCRLLALGGALRAPIGPRLPGMGGTQAHPPPQGCTSETVRARGLQEGVTRLHVNGDA